MTVNTATEPLGFALQFSHVRENVCCLILYNGLKRKYFRQETMVDTVNSYSYLYLPRASLFLFTFDKDASTKNKNNRDTNGKDYQQRFIFLFIFCFFF